MRTATEDFRDAREARRSYSHEEPNRNVITIIIKRLGLLFSLVFSGVIFFVSLGSCRRVPSFSDKKHDTGSLWSVFSESLVLSQHSFPKAVKEMPRLAMSFFFFFFKDWRYRGRIRLLPGSISYRWKWLKLLLHKPYQRCVLGRRDIEGNDVIQPRHQIESIYS